MIGIICMADDAGILRQTSGSAVLPHLVEGPAKELRRVQNESIGAIYDLVRSINQRVGNFAAWLLEETD